MDKTLLRNIIISVIIVLGLGFLYWKFDYSKNSSKISELKAEYDKLNTQVAEARKVASKLEEFKKKLINLERQLKIANRMLPDTSGFEMVIDTVTILAERNNVKIKKMTPLPISRGTESSSVKFNLDVLSTFNNLGLFLTELGNQTRIYKISNISINPVKSSPEGDYSIKAKFELTTFFKGVGENNQKGGKNAKK